MESSVGKTKKKEKPKNVKSPPERRKARTWKCKINQMNVMIVLGRFGILFHLYVLDSLEREKLCSF